MNRWALVLAVPVALVLEAVGATGARAQSLVDAACRRTLARRARALDIADTTPAAENLRRACRLERFEDRLAADRSQQVATQELTREARIQQWIDATQPSRVTRPLAFEGFVGTGLVELRRRLLVGLSPPRRSWRPGSDGGRSPARISTRDSTSTCGRTAYGLRGRWYLARS